MTSASSGLGYANLGALLMSEGLPYDSDEGRAMAGAITALMTGRAYRESARVAAAMGPYEKYELNREPHNHVMRKHRDAAWNVLSEELVETNLLAAARRSWDEAVEFGEDHGYRNAQATVLAPTGTISFLMDCDTTGIEPDFSLVKFKELVGGGQMTIVNRTIPAALVKLGYNQAEVDQIVAYIDEQGTCIGAPGLKDEHLPVFDVAVGKRAIHHMGHVKMMAAAQPFLSGAISKTVNLPAEATDRGRRRDLHGGLEAGPEGAGHLPRRVQDRAGAAHRGPGREGRGRHADHGHLRGRGRRPASTTRSRTPWPPRRPSAAACRASASRSPTSSRSPGTRATSRPGPTRTAPSARSSSPTSARRARPSAA